MIFSLCSALASFAQGNGMAGISEATNMVTSYFDPATKLIYAIGAVVGLIGDPRTSRRRAGLLEVLIGRSGRFEECHGAVSLVRLSGDRRYGLTFVLPLSDGRIPSEQGRGPSGRVSGRARNGSLANASIARC